MKKNLLLLLLIICNLSFSQDYRSGYYISKSGNKVEGLILDSNLDRDYINFKSDSSSSKSKIYINTFKELTIGSDKYISADVEYAINRLNEFSRTIDNEPKMDNKRLLLKTLIEGNATLYQGVIEGETVYYLKMLESNEITYLLYYKYPNSDVTVADITSNENLKYQKQLFQYLRCGKNSTYDKFYNVQYFESELKKLVNDYNISLGSVSKEISEVNEKFKLKFSVFAGVKSQVNNFKSQYFYGKPESDAFVTPSAGLEMSLLLPSASRAFEVFFKATYDRVEYESRQQTKIVTGVSTVNEIIIFKTNFLHFDLGPRYYFSGKSKSSLFIEAAIQYNLLLGDNFIFSYSDELFNVLPDATISSFSFGGGIGYIFNRKYSVNLGGSFGANYMQKNSPIENNSSSLSLNLKYTF